MARSRTSFFSPRNNAKMRCDGSFVRPEIEIVAELGAGFSLAISDPRGEAAARPHLLAQRTDEIGVFREPLDQNGARTFERGSLPHTACDVGVVHVGFDNRFGVG